MLTLNHKGAWYICISWVLTFGGMLSVFALNPQKTINQDGNELQAKAVNTALQTRTGWRGLAWFSLDDQWHDASAAIGLYLGTYQTGWFYGLCLVGLLLLIAGLYKLRFRHLMAHEVELEALVELHTKELREQRVLLQEQQAFQRKIIDLMASFTAQITVL